MIKLIGRYRKLSSSVASLAVVWFILFPIIWVGMASFKDGTEVKSASPIFTPTFENYRIIFEQFEFGTLLLNSLIVCIGVVVVTVPFAGLGAYALARFRIPGKRALLVLILATQFFPPVVMVLPYFSIFRDLQLLDSYLALIIINLTRTIPFCMWLLYGFMDGLPVEIEEAAMVDGCSELQIFRRVTGPLALPGFITAAIFAFILSWNEFLYAFLIGTREKRTAIIGLVNTVGERDVLWEQMSAAGMVVMIPMLFMAYAIRKYFVEGITMGAVK